MAEDVSVWRTLGPHGRDIAAAMSAGLDFLDGHSTAELPERVGQRIESIPAFAAAGKGALQDSFGGSEAGPTVIGVKPYYSLIAPSRNSRDEYLEAGIFDFLPHHLLEVLNDRRAWVTLHVPRADRLGHPENIREIREIRRRYPDIVLVIAHLGRCHTEPHAAEALPQLADEAGLYFDNSAVLNPATHRIALECFGPERILYGTDNPVFYMRGRRQWQGRRYINRTNHPFHFNKHREPPASEPPLYEVLTDGGGIPADSGVYRCPGDKVKELVHVHCRISYFFDAAAALRTYQDLSATTPILWDCDQTDLLSLNGRPVELADFHGTRALLYSDGHTDKQDGQRLGWDLE